MKRKYAVLLLRLQLGIIGFLLLSFIFLCLSIGSSQGFLPDGTGIIEAWQILMKNTTEFRIAFAFFVAGIGCSIGICIVVIRLED